jgi:hypothetical protein
MVSQTLAETREEFLIRNRKSFRHWRLKYPEKSLLRLALKRSVVRGSTFSITVGDVVIPTHCPVLGIPLFVGNRQQKDNSPTIDEIHPGGGYVKGNIAVISWRANRLKSDATLEEMRKVVKYYESHR